MSCWGRLGWEPLLGGGVAPADARTSPPRSAREIQDRANQLAAAVDALGAIGRRVVRGAGPDRGAVAAIAAVLAVVAVARRVGVAAVVRVTAVVRVAGLGTGWPWTRPTA